MASKYDIGEENICPTCGYKSKHFKLYTFDKFRHKQICIECYERAKHRKLTIGDVYIVNPKNSFQKQLKIKFL
jgi:hypothetical protein